MIELVLAGAHTSALAANMAPIEEQTVILLRNKFNCPDARYDETKRPNVPGSPRTAKGAASTKKLVDSAQSPSWSSAKKRHKTKFRIKPIARCKTFATNMNESPEINESASRFPLALELFGSELNMATDIRSKAGSRLVAMNSKDLPLNTPRASDPPSTAGILCKSH